jgi:hypothetical protein
MRIASLLGPVALAIPLLATPSSALAGGTPSVGIAPPVLPVYTQPVCPGPGYLWQPGYWGYGDYGYYWVPGLWVVPPQAGLLWTPGYWGFAGGVYAWHVGYWGPTVGFYGGVNYGFGYTGVGFYGGYWRGGQFFYNSRVANINRTTIHNVYSRNVVNERGATRVSYNGGPHGVNARPTPAQVAAARGARFHMTSAQSQHERVAGNDRSMLASVNHGRPDVASASRREGLNNRAPATRAPETRAPETRNRPVTPERTAPNERRETRPEPNRPERSTQPSTAERSARPAPSHPNNGAAHRAAPSAKPSESEHRSKPAAKPAPKSHTSTPPAQSSASRPATHEQTHPKETKKPSAETKKPGPTDH